MMLGRQSSLMLETEEVVVWMYRICMCYMFSWTVRMVICVRSHRSCILKLSMSQLY